MARPLPWFKLWHEARTDAKLRNLTDDEFRVWFNLLCFAAESEDRGSIGAMNAFLLAVEVSQGDEDLLNRTLCKLERLRIIEWGDGDNRTITFSHFDGRQYEKPSDHPDRVSERVKKHRNADVTPVKRDETPSNALDVEVEVEVEGEKESISRKREPTKRKIAVPSDYQPTQAIVEASREKLGFDEQRVNREVEKFIDFHTAKGSLFLDMHAAFRTWLRNAKDFDGNRGGSYGKRHHPQDGPTGPAPRPGLAWDYEYGGWKSPEMVGVVL